jgi:biotin operon repressor
MTKIDFGNNENFIKKYQELKSAAKVGEFYNCSKTTVLKHAKDIGFDVNAINRDYKLS